MLEVILVSYSLLGPPPVERLNFHLENEQQVIFSDSTNIEKIVRKEGIKKQNSLSAWRQIKGTQQQEN
jgi:hypothetical protein